MLNKILGISIVGLTLLAQPTEQPVINPTEQPTTPGIRQIPPRARRSPPSEQSYLLFNRHASYDTSVLESRVIPADGSEPGSCLILLTNTAGLFTFFAETALAGQWDNRAYIIQQSVTNNVNLTNVVFRSETINITNLVIHQMVYDTSNNVVSFAADFGENKLRIKSSVP